VYQPYPGGAEVTATQGVPAPPSVRNAIKLMYAGAIVSVIWIAAVIVTKGDLKGDIKGTKVKGVPITPSQLNTAVNAAVIVGIIVGLISIGLWIFAAVASKNQKNWVRITGLVLLVLDTLALLGGPNDLAVVKPGPALAKVVSGVLWVIGLATVIFLWRKSSKAFFKPANSA
jgi:hypothetical protein